MTAITPNLKLTNIFNTLDRDLLKKKIIDNYCVQKGITTLVDSVNGKMGVITYEMDTLLWRFNGKIIDTNQKSKMAPFWASRISHKVTLTCPCGEYSNEFLSIVKAIVDVYCSTVGPVVGAQKIAQLQTELLQLQEEEPQARAALRRVAVVIEPPGLKELKEDFDHKDEEVIKLKKAVTDLGIYQALLKEYLAKTMFAQLSFNLKNHMDKKLSDLKILTDELNIATNDLKTEEEVAASLVLGRARLRSYENDLNLLQNEIETIETTSKNQFEQARLLAFESHLVITDRIEAIEKEINSLNLMVY